MTMAGGSTAFVRNHHIRIEAFADSGSPRRQRHMALATQSVVLLFFVLLTVVSVKLVSDEFVYEEILPAIGLPMWWYTIWLSIMSAVISLRTLGVLLRLWRGEK
jgi:TRAP-type transport system small permease protein